MEDVTEAALRIPSTESRSPNRKKDPDTLMTGLVLFPQSEFM